MPGGDGTGPDGTGPVAGRGQGRGRGRGPGYGLGPAGECYCPNCGHREVHERAAPCFNKKCPKCGTLMTRA
jgi:hypothetical protein